jgi:hypothetical protein
MATATRVVGNKEVDGEGGKGNGYSCKGDGNSDEVAGCKEGNGEDGRGNSNGNKDGGQQRGQWQGRQGQWRRR